MRRWATFAIVTLLASSSAVVHTTTAARADAPLPAVNVGDVSVVEGDTGFVNVIVPVDLSIPAPVKAVVGFVVEAGTATAGTDFVAHKGTLTFPIGIATRRVTVKVLSDTIPEPDKTVVVRVTSVVNAQLGIQPQGTVTIKDNDSTTGALKATGPRLEAVNTDAAPPDQVSLGDLTVVEADAGVHLAFMPLTLSEPAPSRIVVDYTTECEDPSGQYSGPTSAKVTFNAGQQSKTLTFHVAANAATNGSATFAKDVSVLSGPAVTAKSQGIGTLVDKDGNLPTMPVGTVELESVNSREVLAQEPPGGPCSPLGHFGSFNPSISSDGGEVAFVSDATNLVPNDNNLEWDVFVRDRAAGTTERVSVASDGSETAPNGPTGASYPGADSPVISGNGRFVTFFENRPLGSVPIGNQIYIHDRVTGQTEDVTVTPSGAPTGGAMDWPATMSADGRYVTFAACDGSNGNTFVSPNPDPNPPPDVTGGNDTCDVFLRDRATQTTTLVSQSMDGAGADGSFPVISADGRFVSFQAETGHLVPGDTNGCADLFVRDLAAGTTERVNVSSSGVQGEPDDSGECPTFIGQAAMSDDGRYVTFDTSDWNLAGFSSPTGWVTAGVHTYRHDRVTGATVQIDAPGAHYTFSPSISGDGRYVSYECNACVSGAAIVNITDTVTGATVEAGVLANGTVSDGNQNTRTAAPVLSEDGTYVVFSSDADNLTSGDGNQARDVFVQRVH